MDFWGRFVALTWLHLSDFHIRGLGDPYDRDVVLAALVKAVRRFRTDGRSPDLVFATGDVAFSGTPAEYEIATAFFDELLEAAGLERRHLFVIPGNHDVDRDLGVGLARSLASREEADAYFAPGSPRPHLTQKQRAFLSWYEDYFAGIRVCPASSCGPAELVAAGGLRVAVLPINSALFCQDDDDHAKLWVGRRSLDTAVNELGELDAELRIALIHHPLDWLADFERSNVRATLAKNVDVVLRGHLHETDVEDVVSPHGGLTSLAAGAAYQTRRWPNRALYVAVEESGLRIFPIRYEDSPSEVWTVDPSVFPNEPDYTGVVGLRGPEAHVAEPAPTRAVPATSRFRSNVPSRRNLPFVGRDEELSQMAARLGEPTGDQVLVVSGPPGVGKSELVREFARLHRDRYPGGTFSIDATSAAAPVDLVRVGTNFLGLEFHDDTSLEDQCEQALAALGAAPALLLYDNVQSFDAIERWLPPGGMPCHVVITAVAKPRAPGWVVLEIEPLPREKAVELVGALAGTRVAELYGFKLAAYSGGLPVQICPTAAVLAYQDRQGRGLSDDELASMAAEAHASFSLVYAHLDDAARLLLHAAAILNPRRIDRAELRSQMEAAVRWSETDFNEAADTCADLHLLQGSEELIMHQLLASFLRSAETDESLTPWLAEVRKIQLDRLVAVATKLVESPADGALAAQLMAFAVAPEMWDHEDVPVTADHCDSIGSALVQIGEFARARPWFERAVDEKRRGDSGGRVDHASLGTSLHQVGFCHLSVGEFAHAREWFELAVDDKRKGHLDGRVDHASLSSSLHTIGFCYSSVGEFEQARPWYGQAVDEARQGDIHGRIDHESLGNSLHQVGFCYARVGELEQARPWYEQAVDASRRGDIRGRIDHESLGRSLHQVGFCYSSVGAFAQARPWYEQAVEEKRQGDIHGRVDHASLGRSLHEVGICDSSVGEFEQARPWYEQSVEEKRQGDIHGRVDHESLGKSLHQVGFCYASAGELEHARPWYEQAVDETRQGDIHGRVNHESLGVSLHQVGFCYSSVGEFEQARPWYERAVDEARQGDIHRGVNHAQLRTILLSAARCLRELGHAAQAEKYEAEARGLPSGDA